MKWPLERVAQKSATPRQLNCLGKLERRDLPQGFWIVVFFVLFGTPWCLGAAPTDRPTNEEQVDANKLAREVFENEVNALTNDKSLWRYRKLEEDGGKKKLYVACQTKLGEIERLIAIDGQPLTPKQQQAEDQRLQKLLSNQDLMRQKYKKQHEDGEQTLNLMKMFPAAFKFRYEGKQANLIKLKFTPNPNFHPANRPAHVFHHMEGTILVDAEHKRLVQIEGRLTSDVKFGGGFLGHLDKGGTFLVKQQDVGSGHWEMTYLDIRINGKVLFFKTLSVKQKEIYSNFQPVPEGITLPQAAELLKKDSGRVSS